MFRILRAIKAHLAAVARTLDPDTLTVDQAARAIELLAAIEKAAAGLRLLLARRVDNASLFGQSGERSAAEWLAKQTGQSTRDAEADLACSKRLRELPDAQDAVRNGELSSDQAKAVADGAAADPSAEQELLDTARQGSLGELSRQSKSRKAAALGDDEARRKAAHRNRSFRTGTSATGEGWGRFTGPAEFVVRLQAHLKPYLDAEFARARAEGRRERADAYAYDALAALLGLADTPAASEGAGDAAAPEPDPPINPNGTGGAAPSAPSAPSAPTPAPAPSPAASGQKPAKAGRPPQVRLILRADISAVRRGATQPGELCDVAGLGPIPVADLLEFLPQAAIDLVVTNGVDAFNVTHFGRQASARQQVVLDLLNIGCSRRGCNATAHLQVDHRVDWAKIKVTELANLDWLCPHDHRLKTYDGWQLEPGTGKRALLPPAEQWWQPDRDGGVPEGSGPPGDPPESHAA
ncbi:MAG: HNH endonuclease [Acidimicrobiales bacterium]|nr:HNH endonuclease [Acidimicrobiales bacterium]